MAGDYDRLHHIQPGYPATVDSFPEPAMHEGMNCRCAASSEDPAEMQALRAENERLKAELHQRTTRFNPCSGRDEPWDPEAVLDDIVQALRDGLKSPALIQRYEGWPLREAVARVVADLSVAEARLSGLPANADPAECAALLGLKAVKVEPGMLLAIREPGPGSPVQPAALKRMAQALLSELTNRFGAMTYGAPTVLCIPHGAAVEAVPTNGRGPVQINVMPEGHPKKSTDVPKPVARAYAEAAAASYGVTPEVVRAKRAEQARARERGRFSWELARKVDAEAQAPGPFITPDVRASRRGIGDDPIGFEEEEP